MDLEAILQNIDTVTNKELKASKDYYASLPDDLESSVSPEPVDVYQQTQDRIYDLNQKSFPKGSSAIVSIAVSRVIDGEGGEGLAKAYKRAKDDMETLKAQGEKERADVRRKQYMQEYFLPAVEIVVNFSSPDEVLNSSKALNDLDKYVLLEGAGKGYTAAYIRQAYGDQLGQKSGRSDSYMRTNIQRVNSLLDNGQVRTALGLAQKLKDQVDKGEKMASDEDYELVSRIVAYYK